MKKYLIYIIIIVLCLAGFFIAKEQLTNRSVTKKISYKSDAKEVIMVWGINYLELPAKELWPDSSYEKDKLVYTKLKAQNDLYSVELTLPFNTILNYWMVQKIDNDGNTSDVWDAGGSDKEYFSANFFSEGAFKPGYFIFLAGFLPILLHYYLNKKKQGFTNVDSTFKIASYIPQLDTIRAVAVLLVILYHFIPTKAFQDTIPAGPLGVNLFFVLSGFLITGILLRARIDIEEKGLRKSEAFKNFYVRRTLRIFPIYYLLLFILLLFNNEELRQNAVYYFSYTSNYLFYNEQYFPANLSHLWSLGVEEQFYIIWPFVLIFSTRKMLPYVIGLFLVIGISSNYIFTSHGWWSVILTTSCFDAFAIGGFLSWSIIFNPGIISFINKFYNRILLVSFVLFLSSLLFFSILPARTVHSLLAGIIIFYCLFKKNNRFANMFLNNRWLIRIGKMSYGIYLYHLIIPEMWAYINDWFSSKGINFLFNNSMPANLKFTWYFIQQFALTILVAIISWYLIEKPINNLKKRFNNKTNHAVL